MITIKDSKIATRVMGLIEGKLEYQLNKGHGKYNHTLDDCSDDKFNWDHMVQEELIDGMQYLVKQNGILKRQLQEEIEKRMKLEKWYQRNMNFEVTES